MHGKCNVNPVAVDIDGLPKSHRLPPTRPSNQFGNSRYTAEHVSVNDWENIVRPSILVEQTTFQREKRHLHLASFVPHFTHCIDV